MSSEGPRESFQKGCYTDQIYKDSFVPERLSVPNSFLVMWDVSCNVMRTLTHVVVSSFKNSMKKNHL